MHSCYSLWCACAWQLVLGLVGQVQCVNGQCHSAHHCSKFGFFLPVTCFSCEAISDSYEAFLDVPLDIKVRGFAVVLQDIPRPLQLSRANTFVLKMSTGDLGVGGKGNREAVALFSL